MTIGTGIFLSTILVCIVWMLQKKKEKWNWKKVWVISLVTILLMGVLGGSLTFYLIHKEEAPKKIDEVSGIKLGNSKEDLKFKKGNPQSIDSTGNEWKYNDSETEGASKKCTYRVVFKSNKVISVFILGCQEYLSPYLNGISKGSEVDWVKEKLGPDSIVSMSKDGLYRAYNYPSFNQFFLMEKGKVRFYGIYNSKESKTGFDLNN